MFRELDIRGKYGSEVTPENFLRLGTAAAEMFGELVVGMDYRPHNEKLLQAFLAGYRRKTVFLGYSPTPATAFLAKTAGLSITASHNPAGYNGAKFFRNRTYVSEEEMRELRKRYGAVVMEQSPLLPIPQANREAMLEYEESIPAIENGVFDLGGGAVCALKHLFPRHIFSEPDPTFSKRNPEPKDETLGELKKMTASDKVAGFAFDGDGDRVMMADGGRVFEGDVTAAFAAERLLKKNDALALSIDCRQEVFDFCGDAGFKVLTSKVGDANVLRMAVEKKAAFSAERSGHYSILRHAPNSDGIYFAAVMSGVRAGELNDFAGRFKNITIKKEEYCQANFEKLKTLFEEKRPSEIITIDGVKAVFDDYTVLVRASTTETKVRINSEARTAEKAREGMRLAEELLSKARIK